MKVLTKVGWDMRAVLKGKECFQVLEFANFRLVFVAFACFHPPDHWSRKQSWREEWHAVANAVRSTRVDQDLSK